MQHQMGRRPLVYMHMTNANIVPMLSFGTMILDHEWRDGGDWTNKDSQERLYLDDDTSLLLAQSTGLQSGCLAVYHDLFHGDERLSRSALGVALTHEMKYGRAWWPPADNAATQMSNFGYGLPDCRVWRYWDDRQPFKTTGVARENPGRWPAAARRWSVVTSYGPAGDVMLEPRSEGPWPCRPCHGRECGKRPAAGTAGAGPVQADNPPPRFPDRADRAVGQVDSESIVANRVV